jgi:hypothetical protein
MGFDRVVLLHGMQQAMPVRARGQRLSAFDCSSGKPALKHAARAAKKAAGPFCTVYYAGSVGLDCSKVLVLITAPTVTW